MHTQCISIHSWMQTCMIMMMHACTYKDTQSRTYALKMHYNLYLLLIRKDSTGSLSRICVSVVVLCYTCVCWFVCSVLACVCAVSVHVCLWVFVCVCVCWCVCMYNYKEHLHDNTCLNAFLCAVRVHGPQHEVCVHNEELCPEFRAGVRPSFQTQDCVHQPQWCQPPPGLWWGGSKLTGQESAFPVMGLFLFFLFFSCVPP